MMCSRTDTLVREEGARQKMEAFLIWGLSYAQTTKATLYLPPRTALTYYDDIYRKRHSTRRNTHVSRYW